MLETPHVIVAAAIAYKVGNPALALPLALGSHFVLEKVPHWNPHLNTEKRKFGKLTPRTKKIILIDSVVALMTGIFVASRALPDMGKALVIVIACFLSVLPDVMEAPYFFWDYQNEILAKLHKFQKSIQSDTTAIPGLMFQFSTILAAFFWIIQK